MLNTLLRMLVALALWSIPVYAQPALIQANYGEAFPEAAITVSFKSPVKAGSLVVIGPRPSSGGTASCTMGAQAFTLAVHDSGIGTNYGYEVLYLLNAAGGETDVYCLIDDRVAAQQRMWIAEFSGVATSGALQDTASAKGSASRGNLINAGSVTAASANALIICTAATDGDNFGGSNGNDVDPLPGDGYTMVDLQDFDDDKTALSYRVVPSSGSYGCTMTNISGFAPDWVAIAVVYAPFGSVQAPRVRTR